MLASQMKELNNGTSIPLLGLGVFRSEIGEQTENAVRDALNMGYRHIDTAMIYKNEESVGRGIASSNVDRQDIFVTTKLWNEDIRQRNTAQAFQDSLDRMKLDYVDLYLIHWPAEGFCEAWEEMEKIYVSGKARAIGVSNFHPHHMEELLKTAKVVPAVNQFECHPFLSQQPLIDYCTALGIACEAYSPLGGQGNDVLSDVVVQEIAKKHQKTPAQVVLRWNLQRGLIVIPKSVRKERIEENQNVFDFELSLEEMAQIHAINKDLRHSSNPDTFDF